MGRKAAVNGDSVLRLEMQPGMSAPKTLATYLDVIRERPLDCRTVTRGVAPAGFEVTAILEHLGRRGAFPTVIFEHPLNMHGETSVFPLVTNLWATRERCAEMLGLSATQAGRELGPAFAALAKDGLEPSVVGHDDAPVQAHVYRGSEADMWILPAVRHFEMDLGPVLTMGHVMRAPGEAFYNVSFVKTFPETGQRGGLTIHSADLSRILRAWETRGERAPVVNILGHHPAFWLGSLARTPYGNNEYATIGAFLREPLRLVPSVTWGEKFLVPADAEILIEGELLPSERSVVDPFGEISRLYQAQELAPTMEVKAITHRDGATLQDVFSGHREHFLLGAIPLEGAIFSRLKETVGGVGAVHVPNSGNGRSTCYVSLAKRHEGHPKEAALQALAQVPGLHTIVVVDEDTDVFDEEDVLWAVNTYVDPGRDVDCLRNMGRVGEQAIGNSHVLIDATRPTHVAFSKRLRVPQEVMDAVRLEEWLTP